MSTNTLYSIPLFFCVIVPAFFAASETAFMSLEKFRLQRMLEAKVKGVPRVSRMMERPERFLSTILLGNNLVNTATAALATTLALSIWGAGAGVAIATFAVTALLLIFGEVVPKTLGSGYHEKVAVAFVRPIEFIAWLFTPLVTVLIWIAMAFTRLMGGKPVYKALVRPEDIESMITVGHKEGAEG